MSRTLLPLAALALPACVLVIDPDGADTGERDTVVYEDVGAFSGVQNATFLDLEVRAGAASAPTATCTEPVLAELRVEVVDDTLVIDLPDLRLPRLPRDCKVTVQVDALERLTVEGVGATDVLGLMEGLTDILHAGTGPMDLEAVTTGELRILTQGTGGLFLGALAADRLRLTHDGTGPVHIAGEATEVTVVATGTGGTDLGDLTAVDVEVDASGTGPVVVNGTGTVTGTLTGTGNITVRGGADVDIVDDGPGAVVVE